MPKLHTNDGMVIPQYVWGFFLLYIHVSNNVHHVRVLNIFPPSVLLPNPEEDV